MTDNLIIQIEQTPENNDSHNVEFLNLKQERIGTGYQSKRDKKICILRCPKCYNENYALAVSKGFCAWCEYNPNED